MQYETSKWAEIRFERDTRYYIIVLQQDLFSGWLITKINGQIGSQLGRSRDEQHENYKDALARLDTLIRYRVKQRHYRLVDYAPSELRTLITV